MATRPQPPLTPNFTGVSLAEIKASMEYERAKAEAERRKGEKR